MSPERSFGDGALLARSVRAVAGRARRTLNRPADLIEVQELLQVIDQLEAEARARSSEELSKWLASLRDRVEDHTLALT